MKEIEQIYYNDFGVAFHWKKDNRILRDKVQLVFRETGFYLTFSELKTFAKNIDIACQKNGCEGCSMQNKCHKFLLKTPLNQVDLAISQSELSQIKDLVEGAIFQVQLKDYLTRICKN